MPFEQRRDILKLLLDRVEIDRDNNVRFAPGIPTEDFVSMTNSETCFTILPIIPATANLNGQVLDAKPKKYLSSIGPGLPLSACTDLLNCNSKNNVICPQVNKSPLVATTQGHQPGILPVRHL